MKLLVVLALVAAAVAAPQAQRSQRQSQDDQIQILRQVYDNLGNGQYNFAYELSNDQSHEERGELKNPGSENESIAVKGSYSWIGPDNNRYLVSYIADENGYQPTIENGPHGRIPPAIAALLFPGEQK